VPSDQRGRLHHGEHATPIDELCEDDEHDSCGIVGSPGFHLPLDIERELFPKEQVLRTQTRSGPEARGEEPRQIDENSQDGSHAT
jgi:hypothetical protein